MGRGLALVTGGSGAVGPALIRAATVRGYRVRCFSRRPPPAGQVPAATEVMAGDVRDPAAMAAAVEGADVVFHLAALLHSRRVTEQVRQAYRSVNVEGTRTVLEAADAAGVGRLVFFSTINVYGPGRSGAAIDEEAAVRPATPYGASKLEAEAIVRAGDTPSVILRLAAVYGPGVKGNYATLVRALRAGWFVPVGNGRNRRTLVHVDDVATAALLAAEHPKAAGRVYNVTDGEVHDQAEILAAMSAALGRTPPRLRLPEAPIRRALGFARKVPGLARTAGAVGNLADKMVEDMAVCGDRLRLELGFKPEYDLLRGWAHAIGRPAL
jgi:UDP-glucose 4-epimerase